MEFAPIAVFLYNRPDHTRRMLDSLARCVRLEECLVTLFCDAPARPEHILQVQAVREIASIWAAEHGARVVGRNQNLGLARSIVSGVSQSCEQAGRTIVIEDDLVLHPQFLNYMLEALDRYKDDDRVAQISGYMFPVEHTETTDAFFLPFITTWGWATWARAWQLFEWTPDISDLSNTEIRRRFNLNGVSSHASMLEDRLANKNQSWGVLFYWAVFKAGKLVLHPRVSLVQNNGFDGSGVHFTKQTRVHKPLFAINRTHWPRNQEIVWPVETRINNNAYSKIQMYRKLSQQDLLRTLIHIKSWVIHKLKITQKRAS